MIISISFLSITIYRALAGGWFSHYLALRADVNPLGDRGFDQTGRKVWHSQGFRLCFN